jgi:hypothetical protein
MDTIEIFSSLLHKQPSSFSLFSDSHGNLQKRITSQLYSLGNAAPTHDALTTRMPT